MKITATAIILSLSATNLHPQAVWWGREVNPSDYTVEKPELPRVSTAGMFVEACLADTSPYYSGNDFTYFYRVSRPPIVEEIDVQSTPFASIFMEQRWEIDGEHVSAFLLRPDFEEYLLYIRSYKNGRHLETCIIATSTMSQIELLLDIQNTFPEMGYDLGDIRERGGNVQFSATVMEAIQFGVREGETDGISWIATQSSHP